MFSCAAPTSPRTSRADTRSTCTDGPRSCREAGGLLGGVVDPAQQQVGAATHGRRRAEVEPGPGECRVRGGSVELVEGLVGARDRLVQQHQA